MTRLQTLLIAVTLGSSSAYAQTLPQGALLVVTKQSHALAIVDAATLQVTAHIPIGEDPHEVIVAPDGRTAYVSNYGEGTLHTLARVDLVAQQPLPPVDISPLVGPHGLYLQGSTLWFTAEGSEAIGTLDPATGKITSILGTGWLKTHLVWVARDGKTVLASNAGSSNVGVYRRKEVRPTVVPGAPPSPADYTHFIWEGTYFSTGEGAEGFAVSPDEREAWVGDAEGRLIILDLHDERKNTNVPGGISGANRLRFTPDGRFVLVTTHTGKDLIVFDAHTREIVKRIPIEQRGASGIQIEPNGKRAFIACPRDHIVAVVDLHTFTLTTSIDAGREPDGLAWWTPSAKTEPRNGLGTAGDVREGGPPAMEFTDKPDFTVAGITDWTAVGGHGSDATLRTSEDMARLTAALKSAGPAGSPGAKGVEGREEVRLREAVTAQPEGYEANRAVGDFYLRANRYSEASVFLEKASRLHGEAAADEYAAALACRGEGDFARARQHVVRALGKEDRAEYHALAGELDERLGDPLGAAREDERAAVLAPSEGNYFAWGSELLLHRAIWQAVEVFSKGAQLHPESQRLKTGWGAALFGGAKYDEAADRLCEASDLDPANRETYFFLGKVGLGSPAPGACVGEKLGRFVRMHPEDAEANYYEAMMLLKGGAAGDRERAGELLQKAVAVKPEFAEGYLQLGILALGRRDDAAAQAEFERAIRSDRSLAEAHYRLGVVYDRTGRGEQAKIEFARHEALVKDQAEAVERERRQVKQFLVVLGSRNTESARQ